MAEKKKETQKIVAQNKKAWHDYFVEEKYEAGVSLCGTEIKSIRQGAVNLKDSYCSFDGGEMFATGVHISPYEQGNRFNHQPLRDKKLLMHKRDHEAAGIGSAKELYLDSAVSLFFWQLCENGDRTLQR